MSITAKEVFDFCRRLHTTPIYRIEEGEEGDLKICFGGTYKGMYYAIDGFHIGIMWPDESKRYPLPKPEYLPVPEWLANWTPATRVMTVMGEELTSILLSHINDNPELPFQSSFDSHSAIAEYQIMHIGKGGLSSIKFVTAEDLFKMDPAKLSHIPGHFYKEPKDA